MYQFLAWVLDGVPIDRFFCQLPFDPARTEIGEQFSVSVGRLGHQTHNMLTRMELDPTRC